MGSGSFSASDFKNYSLKASKMYDVTTGRVSGQVYRARSVDPKLAPLNVMRECCNSTEHPNTVPVILALDVTGSMGNACQETAEALGVIMTDLYSKFEDVQIMVMGIGDLAYDDAPIQISQFESDVRIAEWLDKIYMEHGGGGNAYESYTAAWYMGLNHCSLDCWKQGRKGIIITMGDEPMNPYLPVAELNVVTGDTNQANIETPALFKQASEKFDIYHIAVNHSHNAYRSYHKQIKNSFGKLLGQRYCVSTIEKLGPTIVDCISNSIGNYTSVTPQVDSEGISW